MGAQASQVQEPLALTPGARNLGTWWKLYTPVKTSAREDRSGHRAPETPSLLPLRPKSIVRPGVRSLFRAIWGHTQDHEGEEEQKVD